MASIHPVDMSSTTISSFLVLLLGTIVAVYVWRLRPTTPRQWVCLAVVIGFLAWILPLMVSLR